MLKNTRTMVIAPVYASAFAALVALRRAAERHDVCLWARSPEHRAELKAGRANPRYLPEGWSERDLRDLFRILRKLRRGAGDFD